MYEGETSRELKCPPHQNIDIIYSYYGAEERKYCSSTNSTEILKKKCQTYNSCTLNPNDVVTYTLESIHTS